MISTGRAFLRVRKLAAPRNTNLEAYHAHPDYVIQYGGVKGHHLGQVRAVWDEPIKRTGFRGYLWRVGTLFSTDKGIPLYSTSEEAKADAMSMVKASAVYAQLVAHNDGVARKNKIGKYRVKPPRPKKAPTEVLPDDSLSTRGLGVDFLNNMFTSSRVHRDPKKLRTVGGTKTPTKKRRPRTPKCNP